MEKVKQMVEAGGVSRSAAIKEALAQNGLKTVTDFATKYDLNRATTTNHLNGVVRASDDTLHALASELGGTPEEWAEFLWLASKPATVAANQ